MKKALVFRTAQMPVVSELFKKLESKNYKIWCVVQEESLNSIKSKHPNVICLTTQDMFLNYKNFKNNKVLVKKLKGIKFNRICAPSSVSNFNDFYEVRRIAYSLGYKKITYWLPCNESVTQKLSFSEMMFETLLNNEMFMSFIFFLNKVSSLMCFLKNRIVGGIK